MNYVMAYEYVFDEIDSYYQVKHSKAYFDFKADYSFKLAQVSVKSFLGKLDEYRFNKYISADMNKNDIKKEKKLPLSMQKMYNAIRILNLMSVLYSLPERVLSRLKIDIETEELFRLHQELPNNFNFLRTHLNELIIRFHPELEPKKEPIAVSMVRCDVTGEQLLAITQMDESSDSKQKCCCFMSCSFFVKRGPDKKPLMNSRGSRYKYD